MAFTMNIQTRAVRTARPVAVRAHKRQAAGAILASTAAALMLATPAFAGMIGPSADSRENVEVRDPQDKSGNPSKGASTGGADAAAVAGNAGDKVKTDAGADILSQIKQDVPKTPGGN